MISVCQGRKVVFRRLFCISRNLCARYLGCWRNRAFYVEIIQAKARCCETYPIPSGELPSRHWKQRAGHRLNKWQLLLTHSCYFKVGRITNYELRIPAWMWESGSWWVHLWRTYRSWEPGRAFLSCQLAENKRPKTELCFDSGQQ